MTEEERNRAFAEKWKEIKKKYYVNTDTGFSAKQGNFKTEAYSAMKQLVSNLRDKAKPELREWIRQNGMPTEWPDSRIYHGASTKDKALERNSHFEWFVYYFGLRFFYHDGSPERDCKEDNSISNYTAGVILNTIGNFIVLVIIAVIACVVGEIILNVVDQDGTTLFARIYEYVWSHKMLISGGLLLISFLLAWVSRIFESEEDRWEKVWFDYCNRDGEFSKTLLQLQEELKEEKQKKADNLCSRSDHSIPYASPEKELEFQNFYRKTCEYCWERMNTGYQYQNIDSLEERQGKAMDHVNSEFKMVMSSLFRSVNSWVRENGMPRKWPVGEIGGLGHEEFGLICRCYPFFYRIDRADKHGGATILSFAARWQPQRPTKEGSGYYELLQQSKDAGKLAGIEEGQIQQLGIDIEGAATALIILRKVLKYLILSILVIGGVFTLYKISSSGETDMAAFSQFFAGNGYLVAAGLVLIATAILSFVNCRGYRVMSRAQYKALLEQKKQLEESCAAHKKAVEDLKAQAEQTKYSEANMREKTEAYDKWREECAFADEWQREWYKVMKQNEKNSGYRCID